MFAAIVKRSRIALLIALMSAPGFAQTEWMRRSDVSEQRQGLKETPAVIEMALDSRTVSYNQDQPPGRVDVEMLTRAENRADALRAQLVNLQMREFELQARIDELDYQMSPESIQRALAFVGSVRPMDELRVDLRARLEREKARTSTQLDLLATARAKLEAAIRDAESECDRLRQRLRLPRVSDDSP
jgi:hypothetical protein